MIDVESVRAIARHLPRSSEHLIYDRVKFRVGSIVWLAFSRDETTMGFAFPKDERDALVAAEPHKFFLPGKTDLRFHWVCAWVEALDETELREIVIDAWTMVVPKKISAAYRAAALDTRPDEERRDER